MFRQGLENLGYIPEVDFEFKIGEYLFTIISTKENAVETVKVKNTKDNYKLKVVS